jgi:hypothetical protein
MEKTCSQSNNNFYERAWALCASLFFHALLVLVLSTTSSFDPTLGRSTRFDIFWVSPSVAAPISPASLDQPRQEIPQRRSADVAELRPETGMDLPAAAPASHADPEQDGAETTPAQKVTAEEPQKVAAKESPAEMAMAIPAPITLPVVRPASVPAAKAPPVLGAVRSPTAKKRTAAPAVAKPAAAPAAAKPAAAPAAARPAAAPAAAKPAAAPAAARPATTPAAAQPAAESHPAEQQQLPPMTEAVLLSEASMITAAATAKNSTVSSAEKRNSPAGTTKTRSATTGSTQTRGAAAGNIQTRGGAAATPSSTMSPTVTPTAGPAPAAKVNHQAASSEKPPESRGIVIASLHGDLKMVISGDSRIKLLVTFREFPKARRNRVQTRAEAQREQRIVPVFVRTQQETREAVIETAREGIYLFSAESEQREPAQATFTLKLFETGSREKVTQIGTRNISGKVVLAKILMPEGILWDDESAFTGSLEDSNSTTKFNAQTGLYWREYND